jgi:hypothetical protein
MLNHKIVKNVTLSACLVLGALGISIISTPKSMADDSIDQLEIGTCQNQRNRVSMRILSTEKVKSNLGYNLNFNLQINNYSSTPIRFALNKIEIEFMENPGEDFSFESLAVDFSFRENGQVFYFRENGRILPVSQVPDKRYFYPEIPSFGSFTFFLSAKVYEDNGKLHFVFFNDRNFQVILFNHKTDNQLNNLASNQVLTARFKYTANRENTDESSTTKICAGDFQTNYVKINLSTY